MKRLLRPQPLLIVLAAILLPGVAVQDRRWSMVGSEEGVNLTVASPFFTVNKKVYSLDDKSLKIVQSSETSGIDKLGNYTAAVQQLLAGETRITTVVRRYDSLGAVSFQVTFLDAVPVGEFSDTDAVSTGFPCFQVSKDTGYGYLSLGGSMFGDEGKKFGKWSPDMNINGGMQAGPLSVFDKSGNALVFSAMDEFMITSPWQDRSKSRVCHGVMATVTTIPKFYSYSSLVFTTKNGINQAFSGWGEVLRRFHGRTSEFRDADLLVNYLGFWTDGGGYYWYKTEPNMTYEQTMHAVKQDAVNRSIPYKYMQLDSWWYFKDNTSHQDVTRWEAMPSIFPSGLRSLWDYTEWPMGCHNRQWSHLTPYAKANGGQYNFIVERENQIALPQDLSFWDYLFSQSRRWGLLMYEQDHMDQQTDSTHAMHTDVRVSRQWLIQMGQAARQHGLTLQYCMSYPRHAMQSLEIPAVTHGRVSDDYRGGKEQWRIGVSSMFAHALGVAPFKDCFWSTDKNQPGNPYNLTEPYPELVMTVATLSTGPVAPADRVGYTNVSLLMRCCNADGLILKPSRPALAIDDQLLQHAFDGDIGPVGEVWTTYSKIGAWYFGIILGVMMENSYNLSPARAGFTDPGFGARMKLYRAGDGDRLEDFSTFKPLQLDKSCTRTDFCLYYTSPAIKFKNTEAVIIGELAKVVPLSYKRVLDIDVIQDMEISIQLQGAIGEHVYFVIVLDGRWLTYECVMDESGSAELHMVNPDGQCKLVSGNNTGKQAKRNNEEFRENVLYKGGEFQWKDRLGDKSNRIKL